MESLMNLTSKIMDFESGKLSEEKIFELFQELVDTGMAWQLQGSYGRLAQNLIEMGLIEPSTSIG
jgi:hypothetical protein